ncbi:MAG: hypothetical protein ABSC06_38755 [Rhodopila sp.]
MFAVSDADAAVIRAAYERDGELSAAIELRRLFPGIADNENARICARTRPATRLRRRKER